MSKRILARFALTALVASTAVVVAPGPAHAAGVFSVTLIPASNGGASAGVSDTIMASNRYLLTLTATGTGTCGLTGPTVQIADADVQGPANPVYATVSGACALYNAVVTYTVTWTGVPGASGQIPVQCTWVRGQHSCSPGEFKVVAP